MGRTNETLIRYWQDKYLHQITRSQQLHIGV